MTPRKLPAHIGGTHRAWKARKRRELRAVERVFDALTIGCAYAPPANAAIGRIGAALAELRTAYSVKAWGR